MKQRTLVSQGSPLRLAMALATVAAMASCGTPAAPTPELPAPPHAYRLEQQPRGASPAFVACVDCAAPTRKTLAGPVRVVAAAPTEPAPSPRPIPAPTTRFEQAMVMFDLNSPKLRPESAARVEALAPLMRLATRIQIIGFTDDLGNAKLNSKLSDARALAVMLRVRDLLGTEPGNAALTATGRPMCCYVADNGNEVRRAPNRRAEIVIELPNTETVDLLVKGLRGHIVAESKRPGGPRLAAVANEERP